jgi:hypothetical protein
MFTFGQNYGSLRMLLVASKIPFLSVAPVTWQSALGVSPRDKRGEDKESDSQFKTRLKTHAKGLFPALSTLTKATADALLLAEFCRRRHEGEL